MGSPEGASRCVNQLHLRDEQEAPEPTSICSNPAGLIHMDDCPVSLGLDCIHFQASTGDPEILTSREHESVHERLMEEFLSRTYHHRVRSLDPVGSPWSRLRDDLTERYGTGDPEEPEPEPGDDQLAAYEDEREQLLVQRRKREQARQERAEQERRDKEAQAVQRAERSLREAEERAARELKARSEQSRAPKAKPEGTAPPARRRKRRRRRRTSPPQGEAAAKRPAPAPSSEQPPRKRRRRRRPRRKRDGDKPA